MYASPPSQSAKAMGKVNVLCCPRGGGRIGPTRSAAGRGGGGRGNHSRRGRSSGRHVKELLQQSRFYRKGRYRIADSTVFRIEDLELGTTLHVLAQGRPDLMHGRAFSLCLLDEPASWSAGSSAEVHAALRTSIGKIPHAKMISLGTAPRDSATWYGRLLESGGKGVHVYKADEEADPWDEAEWKAANPSWAFMPPLRKAIREEAEEVKIRPDLMPAFRAFRLNQGTDPTDTHRLVSQEEWRAIEEEGRGIEGRYVLALDWAGGYSHGRGSRGRPHWTPRRAVCIPRRQEPGGARTAAWRRRRVRRDGA